MLTDRQFDKIDDVLDSAAWFCRGILLALAIIQVILVFRIVTGF